MRCSIVSTCFSRPVPSTRRLQGLQHTGDPIFCRPWSLLGLPCVHLPFATGATGLPVGLQLVGRFGEDHRLMAAAQWAMQRLA